MIPSTFGIILAGGLARRMDGIDKPLAEIAGIAIIDRVIAALRPQCAGLIVNANGDTARFAGRGLAIVPDDVPGFAGPLAGILAGLDRIARDAPDIAWALSAAADTPFLPGDLAARLHAARERAALPFACAASGGHTHPVIGLWPVACRHALRRALTQDDERKIDRFTARGGCATAGWAIEPFDPFFNVNTREDLQAAEVLAARPDVGRAPGPQG